MKMSFITISTNDLDDSIRFYEDVLNFKVTKRYKPNPDMEIAFLTDGVYTVEFISGNNVEAYSGKGISLGFSVENMEETKAFLLSKNVKITREPVKMPNGVVLMGAADNNGLAIGFVKWA